MSTNKIVFLYLSPEDSDYSLGGKRFYQLVRRPQLGFQYLSAVLNENNFLTEILDQCVSDFSMNDLIHKIKNEDILFIGIYTVDSLEKKVKKFISNIRKVCRDIPLVVGGPGALAPGQYLYAGCDLVCDGEGEQTVVEIAEYLKGKGDISKIKGIYYKKNGKIIKNVERALIDNIDSIPYPKRDSVNFNKYRDLLIINSRLPYTTMIASRGCYCKCSFCTSPVIWQNKLRIRSPQNVVREIDELVKKYGVKYIAFQDDIFGIKNKWVREFSQLLIKRKYNLNWMCIVHPTSFKKNRQEMLDLLYQAGCNTISMGLQSGNSQILSNINRDPKEPEMALQLIQAAKRRGILTYLNFIFGLPGETEDTIKETIKFAIECKPHHASFFNLTILKGSEIDKKYRNKDDICKFTEEDCKNWAKYATRTFYMNPIIASQLICYILRYRPSRIITALKILPILVNLLGLSNRKAGKTSATL